MRLTEAAMAAMGEAAWQQRAWQDVIRAYRALPPGGDGEEAALRGHRLGVALDKSGDLDAALAALAEVADAEQASPDVRAATFRLLAELYERAGHPVRAAEALAALAADRHAEVSEGARAEAWFRAGELYRRVPDRVADAERCLEAALRLASDHLPALDALEQLKRSQGDHERVAVILGRKIAATARHPGRQKALLARLAELQREMLGRPDVARATYGRALEIDPDYRPALRFFADDARERDALDEAFELCERLAGELPGDVDLPDSATALLASRVEAALTLGELAAADRPRFAERALPRLRQLAELSPETPRLRELADAIGGPRGLTLVADGSDDEATPLPAPDDPVMLRERADQDIARGNWRGAAEWLEAMVASPRLGDAPGSRRARAQRAELFLELADLYYDRLEELGRARAAMWHAAECYGAGARRDATLRILAAEAAAQGAHDEAISAYDAIEPARRTASDQLNIAKCHQRLGRDHLAIAVLEEARAGDVLSDEGAMLLFALHREATRKAELADALERGAEGVPAAEARVRLREALELCETALGDWEAATRVRARLAALEPAPDGGSSGEADDAIPAADDPEATTPDEPAPADEVDLGWDTSDTAEAAAAARAADELRIAADLEARDQPEAAVARYEAAWALTPGDRRPLEALERLYSIIGDMDGLTEVLGRLTVLSSDRAERARLWFRRAKIYRDLLHREPETYRCLKEAHANAPDDKDVAYALRAVAMARGEWALAAELLYREIAAATSPREAGALHLELAMIYDEKLLDGRQAQRNYEQALALDPEIPAAPRPLARLYQLGGRFEDAARVGALAADRARTQRERAELLRHAAMNAERAELVDEARRLYHLAALAADDDVDSDAAHAALARLSGPGGDGAAELIELKLREADQEERLALLHELLEQAAEQGDAPAVRRHATALLALDAADASAYRALRAAAELDRDVAALTALLEVRAPALRDLDERAACYYELGRLYSDELRDLRAAVGAYEQALAADADHPAALEALADIAYTKNDWPRARALYARLDPERCSLAPDTIAYRRGEIAEVLGDDAEAQVAFAEAVRLCPPNRAALTALARTALRTGDLDAAVAASRSLLELLPPDDVAAITGARLQLAELCHQGGDAVAAIYYYELVLSEDPRSTPALRALTQLYGERGNHEGAARTLGALISQAPSPEQRAELLFELGELYLDKVRDPDRAADAYLKGIDLDPRHVGMLRRLVDHYWRSGDAEEILEMIEELLRQDALLSVETNAQTLGRALVVVSVRGNERLAVRIAAFLGAEAVDRFAAALVEEVGRGAGVGVAVLSQAARRVCDAAPELAFAELLGAIECAGSGDEDAARLLAALRQLE